MQSGRTPDQFTGQHRLQRRRQDVGPGAQPGLSQQGLQLGPLAVGHQLQQRLLLQGTGLGAEHRLGLGVGQGHPRLAVEYEHAVGGRLDDAAVPGLGGPQGPLLLLQRLGLLLEGGGLALHRLGLFLGALQQAGRAGAALDDLQVHGQDGQNLSEQGLLLLAEWPEAGQLHHRQQALLAQQRVHRQHPGHRLPKAGADAHVVGGGIAEQDRLALQGALAHQALAQLQALLQLLALAQGVAVQQAQPLLLLLVDVEGAVAHAEQGGHGGEERLGQLHEAGGPLQLGGDAGLLGLEPALALHLQRRAAQHVDRAAEGADLVGVVAAGQIEIQLAGGQPLHGHLQAPLRTADRAGNHQGGQGSEAEAGSHQSQDQPVGAGLQLGGVGRGLLGTLLVDLEDAPKRRIQLVDRRVEGITGQKVHGLRAAGGGLALHQRHGLAHKLQIAADETLGIPQGSKLLRPAGVDQGRLQLVGQLALLLLEDQQPLAAQLGPRIEHDLTKFSAHGGPQLVRLPDVAQTCHIFPVDALAVAVEQIDAAQAHQPQGQRQGEHQPEAQQELGLERAALQGEEQGGIGAHDDAAVEVVVVAIWGWGGCSVAGGRASRARASRGSRSVSRWCWWGPADAGPPARSPPAAAPSYPREAPAPGRPARHRCR